MCLEKHCPDFLSPPPDASAASFEEELERLGTTSPDTVFEEFEALAREEEQFGPLPPEKKRLLGRSWATPRPP